MQQGLPVERAGALGRLLRSGAGVADLFNSAASQSHLTLGGLARDRGDLAVAGAEYKAALESAAKIRNADLARGVAMMELGHNSHLQGNDEEAESLLRRAHPLLTHAQGPAYVPLDTYLLGLAQAGMQKWEEALATLQEAEDLYSKRDLAKGVLDSRLARTDILIRTGRMSEATLLAKGSADLAKGLDEPIYMAQARWHLSRINRAENHPDQAEALLNESIKLYERAGDSWHQAQSLMVKAELQQEMGRVGDADRTLDDATRIATQSRSPFLEADCMAARATLRAATGKTEDARRLLLEARRIYQDQGRENQVRTMSARIAKLHS
jgi:tetratricopeptide (TPR) repeat protein